MLSERLRLFCLPASNGLSELFYFANIFNVIEEITGLFLCNKNIFRFFFVFYGRGLFIFQHFVKKVFPLLHDVFQLEPPGVDSCLYAHLTPYVRMFDQKTNFFS